MADASGFPYTEEIWTAGRDFWERWGRLWTQPLEPQEPAPQSKGSDAGPFRQLQAQVQLLFRLGEDIADSLLRTAGGSGSAQDWQRLFDATVEVWRTALGQGWPSGTGTNPFWQLPFDTWSRTASSASIFPGDLLGSLKPDVWSTTPDGLHRNLERFLSVPGLGYTREWQEQGQELAKLALSYQVALQEYASLFRGLTVETLNRLHRALSERSEQGKPVTTLRGLYDLWVDSAEAAYLDLVNTEAYAAAYGRMVNALMALKRHGRNMVDEAVGAMGIPTQHGLNALQRGQRELRRELAALRAQLADAGVARAELAELRREVERLRAEREGAGGSNRRTRGGGKAGSKPKRK